MFGAYSLMIVLATGAHERQAAYFKERLARARCDR
jgi:hypothetical protein